MSDDDEGNIEGPGSDRVVDDGVSTDRCHFHSVLTPPSDGH